MGAGSFDIAICMGVISLLRDYELILCNYPNFSPPVSAYLLLPLFVLSDCELEILLLFVVWSLL